MQILGYRHLEVGGISPWTVIEGGPLDESNPLCQAHQYAYQPMAAYPLEYDRRFYSGEQVPRRLDVFNEVLERSPLELAWTLSRGDEVLDRGQQQLQLDPGERAIGRTAAAPAAGRTSGPTSPGGLTLRGATSGWCSIRRTR